MQVQVDIGFEELLQIVKNLPATQLSKIDNEVQLDEKGADIEAFWKFFVKVAALVKDPTSEEMAKIFTDHEMQVVGPTLKID